ncbi:hypothetical protein PPL_10116 [Heterostelium album PN500]|uniref:Uncharacterized protein n=1 Tax=Heterostelium pallidum (strain ATCC 26659 / Pp 5 / PN500) TaxID=670386 RepID=D3BQD1_HETP5|nr:hypothetical protein PPL_10116 [Heterostelium album PN500]EFA76351.1 hypothetical protein PPL_10116 [Heterostelium album PN500]|eukprot:XP_020428483.1 hypothetical protein PPL_10116 [Heterostelium album PN500]
MTAAVNASQKRKQENDTTGGSGSGAPKVQQTGSLVINLDMNDTASYYVDTLDNLVHIVKDNTENNIYLLFIYNGDDDKDFLEDQSSSMRSKLSILLPSKKIHSVMIEEDFFRLFISFKASIYNNDINQVKFLPDNDYTKSKTYVNKINNIILYNSNIVLKHHNHQINTILFDKDTLIVDSKRFKLSGEILQISIVDDIIICLVGGLLKFISFSSLDKLTLDDELKYIDVPSAYRLPNNILYFNVTKVVNAAEREVFNLSLITYSSKLIFYTFTLNNDNSNNQQTDISSSDISSTITASTASISDDKPTTTATSISKWPRFTEKLIKVKEQHKVIMDKIKSVDRSQQSINQLISVFSKKPFTSTSPKFAFSSVITPLVSPLVDLHSGSTSIIFRFTLCNHTSHSMSEGWNLLISFNVTDYPLNTNHFISHPINLSAKSSTSFELSVSSLRPTTSTITFRQTLSFNIPQPPKTSINCNFFVSERTFHLLDFIRYKTIASASTVTTPKYQVDSSAAAAPASSSFSHSPSLLDTIFNIVNSNSGSVSNIKYLEYVKSQCKSLILPVNGYQIFSNPEINHHAKIFSYLLGKEFIIDSSIHSNDTSHTLEISYSNFKSTLLSSSHDQGKSYSIQFGSKESSVSIELRHLLIQSLLQRDINNEKLKMNEDNYSRALNFLKDKMKVWVPRKESMKQSLRAWQSNVYDLIELGSIDSYDSLQSKIEQNSSNLQKIQDLIESIIII